MPNIRPIECTHIHATLTHLQHTHPLVFRSIRILLFKCSQLDQITQLTWTIKEKGDRGSVGDKEGTWVGRKGCESAEAATIWESYYKLWEGGSSQHLTHILRDITISTAMSSLIVQSLTLATEWTSVLLGLDWQLPPLYPLR